MYSLSVCAELSTRVFSPISAMKKSLFALPLFLSYVRTSAVLPSVRTQNLNSSINDSEDVQITQDLASPFPYEFPYLGNVSDIDASRFPMPQCNGIAIEEATVDQLQHAMSIKRLTSVQLALCYLQRIYQTDPYIKWVPKLGIDTP